MVTKYRVIGGIAFILSAIGLVVYLKYSDIKSVEDIEMGWGLLAGLIFSLMVTLNFNGMIEKRVAEDKELVTGFEGFSVLQMRLLLAAVIIFVLGVGVWIYFVLR